MMRELPLVLASLLLATLGNVASAQIAEAQKARLRGALAQVEVTDQAVLKAQEIMRKKIPLKQREDELKKLRIRQQFRLLVNGIAVTPMEIVTPALHPTARLRVIVTYRDGRRVKGEVVGNDPRSNLALIRTDVAAPNCLAPGESPVVRGQHIELIGHRSRDGFDAQGIVTLLHLETTCHDIYSVRKGTPLAIGSVFVVATTGRRVNPGSACIDREGRLVGLLLGCAPAQAVPQERGAPLADMERSFVIPSRRVRKVIKALREHGRVIRAEFGLRVRPVSDALRAHLPKVPAGAGTVANLKADGPAAAGGVRPNDILLSVNGEPASNVCLLRESLIDCTPGKKAKLRVLRAGEETVLTVVPRLAK